MRHLQFGFSTLIVGFSHDDFNLHHWLIEEREGATGAVVEDQTST